MLVYVFYRVADTIQISQHALNSLFALTEIIIPATSHPPWLHVAFLVVILLLYLALAYITHATQGFYTYSFLDPAGGKGIVAGYCFGIAAAIVIVFVVVWAAIWLRERYTRPAKRSKKGEGVRELQPDVEMVHRK